MIINKNKMIRDTRGKKLIGKANKKLIYIKSNYTEIKDKNNYINRLLYQSIGTKDV